jgi:GNAT superfamily N-acetyltransferase
MQIRFATESDAQLLLDMAMEAFAEYRDTIVPPPAVLFETVEIVRAAIRAHGAVTACEDNLPVGSARSEIRPGYLYIGRLAVLPAFRGRGIGRALIAFLESHAIAQNRPETRVEVRMALPDNVAMFAGLGYVPISYQSHLRVPEAMTVVMAKSLAQAN